MRPAEERKAQKDLRNAIQTLQSLDGMLLDVLARDAESSAADGFGTNSLGGGSGGRGSHSDRTGVQATRGLAEDGVHASILSIVQSITLILAAAKKSESRAVRLTSHIRRTQRKAKK